MNTMFMQEARMQANALDEITRVDELNQLSSFTINEISREIRVLSLFLYLFDIRKHFNGIISGQ